MAERGKDGFRSEGTARHTFHRTDAVRVEIAKAVSQQAKVVIFDEPTSSSDNEVEALFRIMNDLRDKGVVMVYISHKMDEIKRIADDITIMRTVPM